MHKGLSVFLFIFCFWTHSLVSYAQQPPNVVIIYVDDLGYGDVGCYGSKKIPTPNLDALASTGLRFTNGHSPASTCTPSRYALMTGQYAWRQNIRVISGASPLIIPKDRLTLPNVFKKSGYTTGIVGKWHLGLGDSVEKDWNQWIPTGPNTVGFDYSFIFPATADRVPTVFLENQKVVGLEKDDPISVSYQHKVGTDPTGREHPELLKMLPSPHQGHDGTIVNGIGRIGYMSGGKKARWTDEELPFTFLAKAKQFVTTNASRPFFLYYAFTEPHVPHMPATMFKGKSELGYRGDVIIQLDYIVGEFVKTLSALGLLEKTLIVFSSDNGPVLNDGYQDEDYLRLNGHQPSGNFRGGKYSVFEAGTRVPFIVSWRGKIQPGVSDALVCQMDFLSSFSAMLHQKLDQTTDSENMWDAFLGKDKKGRSSLVEHSGTLALVEGNWKYIRPREGKAYYDLTFTETGYSPLPQLYNLETDPGEKINLAEKFPERVARMENIIQGIEQRASPKN